MPHRGHLDDMDDMYDIQQGYENNLFLQDLLSILQTQHRIYLSLRQSLL